MRARGFMGSNGIKLNSVVQLENLLNLRIIGIMGLKMSTKLAMLSAYKKSETLLVESQLNFDKHVDKCLDPKCCATCDRLAWRVLEFETELEILLEDIKAL